MRVSVGLATIVGLLLPSTATAVDYVRDVQPILRQHCYRCHGALVQKGGLRVDHATFLRSGGDRGAAIATSAEDSLLVQAVRGTLDTERMPLESPALSEAQIATLAAWIEAGANAPEEPLPEDPRQHWSFQRPARGELPVVGRAAWQSHAIDRFLAAEHETRGLEPAPPASKNVLLRRVYLDLIGLPPTPEQLRAFQSDDSPDAYERVVDQLLASPHYGERWGRHWMDVWRYSDWDGYGAEVRESQPHIWRWRDWIIESLNADKPYDQMVVEMLAADEIAPEDSQTLRAGGFLARNWYRFNRNVWLDATVEHTSKAFLGITLNCARCHDHMYDPIPQTEYYQFRAVFEPHNIRTDRVPGQSDTKQAGLVRAYDAEADKPTYLFARGNEAQPDKAHPLEPGAPAVLGGGPLMVDAIRLPAAAYYPGLREFVQQETWNAAVERAEAARQQLAASTQRLGEARRQLAMATNPKPPVPPAASGAADAGVNTTPVAGDAAPAASPEQCAAALAEAESQAQLAEQALLASEAARSAVRAKIAADRAVFSTAPTGEAAELSREASRAERLAAALEARYSLAQAERQAAQAKGDDPAGQTKAEAAAKQLAEARKAHEAAQAALAETGEKYTRFSEVYPAASTGRRSALARWIASKENPLTARVAINHIWMRHFGAPLVASIFDLGRNGQRPTHPRLLDWLAVELMEGGWHMKPIHRLLVTSTAYRMQSSGTNQGNLAVDAENRWLWRMNTRRMEAEAVRDSALAAGGGLDATMFGPELDQASGLTVPRRSVYFRSSKEKKVTFLEMFDSPNVTDCYRRSETVVPQQALAMVNSSLTLAQSRRLAGALAAATPQLDSPQGQTQFVAAAFERLLCRPASDEERKACVDFLQEQAHRLSAAGTLQNFASAESNAVPPSADPAQRARENLVHVLLNHHDFVTIR